MLSSQLGAVCLPPPSQLVDFSHWKQFQDEAGEGKLWKAATYMKPRETWDCVPALLLHSFEGSRGVSMLSSQLGAVCLPPPSQLVDFEKAKSSHWKQFQDEAGEGKLWKAATYMKPRETWVVSAA
jgi:hypothetical protein